MSIATRLRTPGVQAECLRPRTQPQRWDHAHAASDNRVATIQDLVTHADDAWTLWHGDQPRLCVRLDDIVIGPLQGLAINDDGRVVPHLPASGTSEEGPTS